jgi:hypothetical protein
MNSLANRKAKESPAVPQNAGLPQAPAQMPLLLDEATASRFLGVSRAFLRRARSKGHIGGETAAPPFVPLGGRRLYRLADLVQWVDGLSPHANIAGIGGDCDD